MDLLWKFFSLIHLIGLALGMGGATVKLTLLLRTYKNKALLKSYLKVSEPISNLLLIGLILLTISGIGWIPLGSSLTWVLGVKHALVALLWVVGLLIDKVFEPKFTKVALNINTSPTPEFLKSRKQMLIVEITGTALFYAITVFGVFV